VYGEHQLTDGDYCCVLGIFERQYKNNEPLTITGDGEQRRDFTYVGDIVDGLVRCGGSMISGETFELGNGGNYSINEVADAFGDYPKEYIETRNGEMRETLNIDNKAQDVLGWKPKGNIIKFIKENLI
jgi:UDP-glucose 4-epimerase